MKATSSLEEWDDLIRDQTLFIRKIVSRDIAHLNQQTPEEASLLISKNYLSLCHLGQNKECLDYAKRTLSLARKELSKHLCNRNVNDQNVEIHIQAKFEYFSTCILKCHAEKDLSLPQRFNALYRNIMELEEYRLSDPVWKYSKKENNEIKHITIKTKAIDLLNSILSEMYLKFELSPWV